MQRLRRIVTESDHDEDDKSGNAGMARPAQIAETCGDELGNEGGCSLGQKASRLPGVQASQHAVAYRLRLRRLETDDETTDKESNHEEAANKPIRITEQSDKEVADVNITEKNDEKATDTSRH